MIKHLTMALGKALAGFITGMLVYLGLTVLWWQFFPYQTAEVTEPMIVRNENKTVGEDRIIMLEFKFTKTTTLTPKVARNILCVDDTVHFVNANPTSGVARPTGTFTAKPMYEIAPSVPKGVECYFQFQNEYQVNPIRTITKSWLSEPFTRE